MPPVIRVTTLDDIVDNYDTNKADTDAAHKGKHAHYSVKRGPDLGLVRVNPLS